MLQSVALVLLSCLLTCATCLLSFINPPPSGKIGDFTKNLAFSTGETLDIAWSGSEEGISASIVLYHLNQTTGEWFSDGDMEYIAQRSLAPGLFTWLVGTRKDLTVSNLFYLSIFQDGKGVSDGNSRYFNITAREVAVKSTTSTSISTSSTPSVSSATGLQVGTSSSILSTSTSSFSEPTGVSSSSTTESGSLKGSSDTFPDSAKVGLGVGIPVALLIGAVAGFFLFLRHKKRVTTASTPAQIAHPSATFPPTYPPSELYSPHKSPLEPYYVPGHELPIKSPVELR